MTYSIVARDPASGQLGVAVQSHFFAAGRVVPWARAGVGAVATQSFAEPSYGSLGLALMGAGQSAESALTALVTVDPAADRRQVAMVDARGGVAAHTGTGCVGAAGHCSDHQVSAQANMMARPTVWKAMIEAYSRAHGDLASRLLEALEAAAAEGGDLRGQQSAALVVVSGELTGRPWQDLLIDLRVDDHSDPVGELGRLLQLDRAYQRIGAAFEPILQGSQGELEAVDDQIDGLARAQEVLGANFESTFWRGVLLARSGRMAEAREALTQAARSHAGWAEMLRRLPEAGLLDAPSEVLDWLLDDSTSLTNRG